MTIAGLYLSPEGIVLGADSTSTYNFRSNGRHYFNHAQKLFEIGDESTFGILTWGMGGIENVSYRAMVARLADTLKSAQPASVHEVAERWVDAVWPMFSALPGVLEAQQLHALAPYDPANPGMSGSRSADQERHYQVLVSTFAVGFCVAGYVPSDRIPRAFVTTFEACAPRPTPQEAAQYRVNWWGMPNIMNRLIYGADDDTVDAIMASGKWAGTQPELVQVLVQNSLMPTAHLPIRDAIDYVHSAIYCTIKAMKFSELPQVCGGPIEIAVITADRKFRWVRHKDMDTAIAEGEAA